MENQTPLKAETIEEASQPLQGHALQKTQSGFPTPAHPTPRFLSRKGAIIALGFITISFLIAFVMGGLMLANNDSNNNEQIACTDEAKICPDGSSVGRTGRACEFAPCPTPTNTPISEWKTYEDDFLSFKYPADHPVEVENKIIYINKNEYSPVSIFARYDGLEYIEKCDQEVTSGKNCLGKGGIENIKSIEINGKTGTEISFVIEGSGWHFHTIQFENPKIILYPSHPDFDLILPTIKFKQ